MCLKKNENQLKSIVISVPEEIEMSIKELETIPITDYVVKISEDSNNEVTINHELIEIIKDNYIVIDGEE